MKISFDLDDTLICHGGIAPCEPSPPWYWKLVTSGEPLREGTRSLFEMLGHEGHEVWIYTTSRRSPVSVSRWLRAHRVRVSGVINQDIYDKYLRRASISRPPSKNPTAFGFDLHVDDSDGVRIEGERHGFSVVVIAPDDADWVAKVLVAVREAERSDRRV